MSDLHWERIETIIDEVLDLPQDQRLSYIEQTCGHNQHLKTKVTQLIDSIFDSEGWLEELKGNHNNFYSDLTDDLESLSGTPDFIGAQLGSYTVKEQIGEGGMGLVFRAERTEDSFDHQVAIKIIRQNRATETNIQRFKREQQILAGLNHPGIAHLYDGGITSDGFPYIIMEYVDGIPITKYCQQKSYSIKQRIHLFKQVLEAVRYAHENLVIHRDLKPDNILVNDNDEIKILDFGISKLLESDEDLNLTQTGSRILTPKYAAPEQIIQTNITTATDLYSLGIIFYELLAGVPPFDFSNCTTYQTEQIILKQNPTKPSTKVSDPKIKKQLKGDLDAITLKAIRKEPDYRYRMANKFLEELKNYQKGIPVTAHENSFNYRSQKFIKRHKQGITVTVGIILLLIGLSGFYTWRIAQERNQAQLQAQRAERQAERAEQVSKFMIDLFDSNLPERTPGKDIPVSAVIDAGIANINEQQLNPVNRATILGVIAQVQVKLSKIESARQLSSEAFDLITHSVEQHNINTVDVPTIYGQIAYEAGDFEEAVRAFQTGDSLFKANNLTNTYEYRTLKYNLVNLYTEQKNYQEALKILDKLDPSTFGDDREAIIEKSDYYNYKAISLKNLGQLREALPIYKKALEYRLEVYGANNPEVGTIYHNISNVYISLEQYEKALEYSIRAYKIRNSALGPNHNLTASTLWGLSLINRKLGNFEEALKYTKEAGTILKETLGADHWRYAYTIRGQAEVLIKMNQFLRAKQKADKAIKIINANYPSNVTFKAHFNATYTNIYIGLEDLDKAAKYFTISISFLRKGMGDKHPLLAEMLISYAKMEIGRENYKKAHPLLKEALEIENYNGKSDKELQATKKLINKCVNKLKSA
ncbi:protein kinase domain-containing protein [Fodinibius sp. Rm-B-1B1-1]|uniref:protein kinase domain-containing protein n=1 Tax=Fodinibius alkaliphilus TaxID=3140241 RepID=UPI00315B0EC1